MTKEQTRVFFVVDSTEDNEEIYETLEEAQKWFGMIAIGRKPRLRIAIVRNAYLERGKWNYSDFADTFETVSDISNYE